MGLLTEGLSHFHILTVSVTWSTAVWFPDRYVFVFRCIPCATFLLICQGQPYGTHKRFFFFFSPPVPIWRMRGPATALYQATVSCEW